jgi:hypothetical protein
MGHDPTIDWSKFQLLICCEMIEGWLQVDVAAVSGWVFLGRHARLATAVGHKF